MNMEWTCTRDRWKARINRLAYRRIDWRWLCLSVFEIIITVNRVKRGRTMKRQRQGCHPFSWTKSPCTQRCTWWSDSGCSYPWAWCPVLRTTSYTFWSCTWNWPRCRCCWTWLRRKRGIFLIKIWLQKWISKFLTSEGFFDEILHRAASVDTAFFVDHPAII